MNVAPLKPLSQRIAEAVQAERERCLDAVRYAYCLNNEKTKLSDLDLAYKLIEQGSLK